MRERLSTSFSYGGYASRLPPRRDGSYDVVVRTLDLNADVGESFGPYQMGDDGAMMRLISSANIACGGHAGDPGVMHRTVELALRHGVVVGAHPGYPDLQGFGRRPMRLTEQEIVDLILYQVGALEAIARSQGSRLRHIKPHGALYNQAETDLSVAEALVKAVQAYGLPLRLVGRAGSAMERAARAARIPFAAEAFADRRYRRDGSLAPRSQPGTVLTEPEAAAAQVRRLVQDGRVEADDGTSLALTFETLCVHGDTPGAPRLAARIRAELEALKVRIEPLPELI